MSNEISLLLTKVPHPSLITFEGEGWFPDGACEQTNGTLTLAKKMWGVTVIVDSDLNLKAKETAGRISNIFARFLLFFPALISLMWNSSLVNDSLTHQVYRCYVGQQTIAGVPKDDSYRLSIEVRRLLTDDKNLKEVVNKLINIKDLNTREKVLRMTAYKYDRKKSQMHAHFIICLLSLTTIPNSTRYFNSEVIMGLLTNLKSKCNEQDYLYIVNAVYDENNEKHSFLLRERGFANYNALNYTEARNDLNAYKLLEEYDSQTVKIKDEIDTYLNGCSEFLKN